jgi:hypothetical protein
MTWTLALGYGAGADGDAGLDEIGSDAGENACAKNVGMKADVAGLKARSTCVEAPGVGASGFDTTDPLERASR